MKKLLAMVISLSATSVFAGSLPAVPVTQITASVAMPVAVTPVQAPDGSVTFVVGDKTYTVSPDGKVTEK